MSSKGTLYATSRGMTSKKSEAMAVSFDFAAAEARAATMTRPQLQAALRDIVKTLPNADALDRQDDGDRGRRYRDEASVYRLELRRKIRRDLSRRKS